MSSRYLLRNRNLLAVTALVIFFVSANDASAQVTTATIAGTVSDATGAVLPGVEMEVKNTGTGAARSVTTDEQGRYNVQELEIGSYDVQAALTGFQTVIHKGITLTVGSSVVVDLTLPVGQVTDSVAVQADITQVETATAALG